MTVLVQTNAECKKNYGNDAPGGIIDSMICAAYPGKDSCSVRTLVYKLFYINVVVQKCGWIYVYRVTAVAQ